MTYYKYTTDRETLIFRNGEIGITSISSLSGVKVSAAYTQNIGGVGAQINTLSVQPSAIKLNGLIVGDIVLNRRRLISSFSPMRTGKLYKYDNDGAKFITVTPTQTPIISDDAGVQDFTIVLFAAYPYWVNAANTTVYSTSLTKLFEFPFDTTGTWQLSTTTPTDNVRIVNSGNVPTGFTAKIEALNGTVTNPKIWHTGSNKYIEFNITLSAGDYITVDTYRGRRRVMLFRIGADGVNAFNYTTLGSTLTIELLPGENAFEISSLESTGVTNMLVTLTAPLGVYSGT